MSPTEAKKCLESERQPTKTYMGGCQSYGLFWGIYIYIYIYSVPYYNRDPKRNHNKVRGKWYLLITGLITLLLTPLNGLRGVTPILSRVINPVIKSWYVP